MDPSDGYSEGSLEEEEEAFIDLNDPNNVVVDDGEGPEAPASDDDEAENLDDGDGAPKMPERDDAVGIFRTEKPLHSLSLCAKRSCLAAGSEDDLVFLCNFRDSDGGITGSQALSGHTDTVTQVAFSPNGDYLASGAMDNSVIIWDLQAPGTPILHKLQDLSGEIECLLWHPSSLVIAAGASDAQAAMWNVSKGTLAQYFVGHHDSVTCLSWSIDVKKLITGSADSSVMVFNPKTAEAETVVNRDIGAGVSTMSIVNDTTAVVGCVDGSLHVIALVAGRVVSSMSDTHQQAIEAVVKCPSMDILAACSCDCQVSVWNTADWTLRTVFKPSDGVTRIVWKEYQLLAACLDGSILQWDGRQSDCPPQAKYLGNAAPIHDMIAVTPMLLATVCDDCTLRMFRLN